MSELDPPKYNQHVIDDNDHWSMVSADIDEGLELLRDMVTLWLTIRGYGITKVWMEDYKIAVSITANGKKKKKHTD